MISLSDLPCLRFAPVGLSFFVPVSDLLGLQIIFYLQLSRIWDLKENGANHFEIVLSWQQVNGAIKRSSRENLDSRSK